MAIDFKLGAPCTCDGEKKPYIQFKNVIEGNLLFEHAVGEALN